MGLLIRGTPLPWPDAQTQASEVRARGVQQFIRLWTTVQREQKDCLKWGDEIEYMVLKLSETQAKLVMRSEQLLEKLPS
jgi:glutamate--cysteine ligase catalytic subunit